MRLAGRALRGMGAFFHACRGMRLPVLLSCVVIAVFMVDAGSASAQTTPTVLRFSFWGNFMDLEFFRQVSAKFEEANPDVKIKLEYITGDYGRKLPLLLVSNTAADIILMDDENYPAYAVRGYLEDLAPYIERDRAELRLDEFLPTSLDSFNYRGFQGGVPWDGLVILIFYNKDIFDAAGVPYPSDDWTWDDFRSIAKRLTKDLDGDGRMDQFGTNFGFGFLGFEPILWCFGGEVLNRQGTRGRFNTPEGRESIQFIHDMKYKDHSIAWTGEMEGLLSEVQLLTGRVGMTLAGTYMIVTLESVKDGMRWDIAHLPRGPRGHRFTRVSWDGISINARTPHKEKAWRFIKFLLGDTSQELVGKMGRGIPVRRADVEKYFIRPDSDVRMDIALAATGYGKITPPTAKFVELDQGMAEVFNLLNTEYSTRDRSRAKILPHEAAAQLDKNINAVLEKELARWNAAKEGKPHTGRAGMLDLLVFLLVPAGMLALLIAGLVLSRRVRRAFRHKVDDFRDIVRSRMGRGEAAWGILFASPWMIGFCMFTLFPICFSMLLSFSEWDPYDPVAHREFVGFDNYAQALTGDENVWIALKNTFIYALFAVPLGMSVSLGLALLLNQKIRGITLFRTVFYIPSIVGGVATSILWIYIFNPVFGPLNGAIRTINNLLVATGLLAFLQLPEPGWLTDPAWAKPSLIIMSLWGAGGAGMLIFLAGLQGVPDQLYEVAELDGARRLRKFWNITLPMLTPTIYFNFIMGLIGSLQVFMQAFVMTDGTGGVDKSLLFYVLYLYQKAFVEYDMGYACALAWILFTIILVMTLAVVKSSALWVYYEGEKGP